MNGHIIVTTINDPTPAVLELAQRPDEWKVVVVGDNKTPAGWHVDGVTYLDMASQRSSRWSLAGGLPENHYCRKNLGYLEAIAAGADPIAETDDDNYPRAWPPSRPARQVQGLRIDRPGWTNVYKYFTDEHIWPRGYPLDEIAASYDDLAGKDGEWDASIHQYLAAGDPDVDAVYRMTVGKIDHEFTAGSVVLAPGSVVPFNSQSTIWFPEVYELLYLPSFVSFRMTDIWRSFVGQACMWPAELQLAYHGEGVFQERNEHSLLRDFTDEIPGYQRNDEIVRLLSALPLSAAPGDLGANLIACYEALSEAGVVPKKELPLVRAWLADVAAARQ